jgi:hypothetical protein
MISPIVARIAALWMWLDLSAAQRGLPLWLMVPAAASSGVAFWYLMGPMSYTAAFQKGLGLWDRDPPGTMPSWGLRNIAFVGLLFACIAVAFANPYESAAGTIVILVGSGVMGGGLPPSS